jgi:hypothetical protein
MHWSLPNQPLQFQRELIETSHPRSEHSQGGAQHSEQYLYGAQRAIKSKDRSAMKRDDQGSDQDLMDVTD